MTFDDNHMFAAELKEKELNLIQGGNGFTREERVEVEGIIKNASEHHGVSLPATIGQVAISTAIGFGSYAVGQTVVKKAKDRKQ